MGLNRILTVEKLWLICTVYIDFADSISDWAASLYFVCHIVDYFVDVRHYHGYPSPCSLSKDLPHLEHGWAS